MRNGDPWGRGCRLVLNDRNSRNMEQVLQIVSDRINLPTGAVFKVCPFHPEGPAVSSALDTSLPSLDFPSSLSKIYTTDGERVLDTSELRDGEVFVAVGRRPFRKMDYTTGKPAGGGSVSPARKQRTLPPIAQRSKCVFVLISFFD